MIFTFSLSSGFPVLYRINWKAQSKVVRGMTINRITNWSAVRMVRTNIQFPLSPIAPVAGSSAYGVRLELDNSTDAERTEPFGGDQLVAVFKELVSFASETALKGDPA